jgi:hypothetical protein
MLSIADRLPGQALSARNSSLAEGVWSQSAKNGSNGRSADDSRASERRRVALLKLLERERPRGNRGL